MRAERESWLAAFVQRFLTTCTVFFWEEPERGPQQDLSDEQSPPIVSVFNRCGLHICYAVLLSMGPVAHLSPWEVCSWGLPSKL